MVIRKAFVTLALVLFCRVAANAQARPTADRVGDLQVGVEFSVANSNYATSVSNPSNTTDVYSLSQPTGGSATWPGLGAYVNFDIRYHFGFEADFHQVATSDPNLYERTFEVGVRYLWPVRGRFVPYGKVMVGRGIFNFAALNPSGQSQQIANIGYNTQSLGGGLDLRLTPGLNVRLLDYEYQRWDNFPPNKLNPQVFSVGVAYHFHGLLGRQ